MKHYYPAVFEPAEEGGYCLTVPDVAGCVTQGDDLDEAMYMAHDAIGTMLEDVAEADYPAASAVNDIDLSGYEAGAFVSLVCFDKEKWDAACYQAMLDINYAKYSQVEDCKKRLLDPAFDGHTFVEASPRDRKWGIGLSVNNPGIDDPANWRGRNLLGKVITEVRDRLVAANATTSP